MNAPIELRALDRDRDLDALVALQRAHAPEHRRWDRAKAESELTDIGRERGANVVVAWRGGQRVGVAGWVSLAAAQGEFYGAPVVAADPDVADALVAHVEQRAREAGAEWVRVSSWPEELAKAETLAARGYEEAFHFVELAAEVAALPRREGRMPEDLGRVPLAQVLERPAAYADLFNDTFRDVPNAAHMTEELAAESLAELAMLEEATQFWGDSSGRYQAFSITLARGYIDAFGVRDGFQRRGVGGAMLARTIEAARAAGLAELTSTVASTNGASLRLHQRFGFGEVERCRVWQK